MMLARLRLPFALVLLLAVAQHASAQDPYALRTAIGSEAYLWELRSRQAELQSKGTPKPNAAAPVRLNGQYTPRTAQAARMTSQTRNALNYWNSRSYGARNAHSALSQIPTRPSFVRQTAATAPAPISAGTAAAAAPKPFAHADQLGTPTVSPYLQLFRQEVEEAAPNYHAFVRPQLERQRERQQRRRDPRQAPVATNPTTASLPAAGVHSSRFGNTGSFYSGWKR